MIEVPTSRAAVVRAPGAPSGKRDGEFPIFGVGLIAALVVLTLARELFVPEGGRNLLRPVLFIAGILIEMSVLLGLDALANARRWPPRGVLASLIATSVAVAVVCRIGARALTMALVGTAAVRFPVERAVAAGVVEGLQAFAFWMLVFRYPRLARDARLRALEADHLREQTELAQLRARLEPHFLRNTLNAVAALITADPDEARRLLATLGDLLDESLEPGSPLQTLEEQMTWLMRYAEILETRHRGTLRFRWDIAAEVRAASLPRLLLQPLVENAVVHGVLCREGGGEVVVRAGPRIGGGVIVVVEDEGPGLSTEAPLENTRSLGLRLVRRRLELECAGARFHLDSSPHGTRATVELP